VSVPWKATPCVARGRLTCPPHWCKTDTRTLSCPTPRVISTDRATGARYAQVGLGACVYGVGSDLHIGKDADGYFKSDGIIGKTPPTKYYPGLKTIGECRKRCNANKKCGGFDLSKGSSRGKYNCLNYISGGQPLLGDRAAPANRYAQCRVKLADPGPYTGKYANLGGPSCQMKGGSPGEKLYECPGCDMSTGDAKCKKLCNANEECGGYSVAKNHAHANCMLWLRPRGASLLGGGAWNKQVPRAKCLVKVLPGQRSFKSAVKIIGDDDDETFEDGTPLSDGNDMDTFRRRRSDAEARRRPGAKPGSDPAPGGEKEPKGGKGGKGR